MAKDKGKKEEAANPLSALIARTTPLFKSNKRGIEWARMALPVVCDVSREIQKQEAARDKETGATKVLLQQMEKPYTDLIKQLDELKDRIKGEVMSRYEGKDTVSGEEGELVFQGKTTFEVTDLKKVKKEFLVTTVNTKALNEQIKRGLLKTPGIKINTEGRILQVRPVKKGE